MPDEYDDDERPWPPLSDEHLHDLEERTWQLADALHRANRQRDAAIAWADAIGDLIIVDANDRVGQLSGLEYRDEGGDWDSSGWADAVATVEREYRTLYTGGTEPGPLLRAPQSGEWINHPRWGPQSFGGSDAARWWLPSGGQPADYADDGQLELDDVPRAAAVAEPQPELDPLARLADVDRAAADAIERRKLAMLDTYRDGVAISEIARTLGISHEGVRKVVRAAGL